MNARTTVPETTIDRLREISHWVSSVLDLDNLLELIIETATKMMQAKASSLLLLDPKTKKLYFKVAIGERKEELRKYEINLGQGIAGTVAQTGEPLLIQDVTRDPRWYKQISESIGFQTRSIACVPMKVGEEIIGVVEIIDKEDGSPIQNGDMKTLTVFTELASLAISNARKINQVQRENRDLKEELWKKYQIIGDSPILKKAISDALKVANSRTSTLILGESGTGKELLARLIHYVGPRKDKPLIILNCAALPETLLEAELFGYEKGAFTGALTRKTGKFELADEGTLFLDEIGEMTQGMQAKLLGVLQEGVFYRVGGSTPITVDVRILCATNRDIGREVSEGRFREDLYYRLNVVQIHMPALRERRDDIALLVDYFLNMFKQERGFLELPISKGAMEKIVQYDWPGNVRELRNAIERAVVMGNGKEVLSEDLPIGGEKTSAPALEVGLSLKEAEDRFKKEFIALNLKHHNGNRSKAAKTMGIQRTYLSRLISKYALQGL
ncbi:MAG: sigma 54-interacting transcriptional regulator [Deltaproteobacteria bacterium]|jgi:Nif-specific regulatory protein|nr:sigma 54-interacting transcriptional regulator [Deltaproteobacteria bacterium]NTV56958.1 sigma 54-interacting transcriptional regulator [Deltaproteobacteria bacterium]